MKKIKAFFKNIWEFIIYDNGHAEPFGLPPRYYDKKLEARISKLEKKLSEIKPTENILSPINLDEEI